MLCKFHFHRYSEVCQPGFVFGNKVAESGTGHFTQVVWQETKALGIAKASRMQNGLKCTYVVAVYSPGGNKYKKMEENVKKGYFDEKTVCNKVLRTLFKFEERNEKAVEMQDKVKQEYADKLKELLKIYKKPEIQEKPEKEKEKLKETKPEGGKENKLSNQNNANAANQPFGQNKPANSSPVNNGAANQNAGEMTAANQELHNQDSGGNKPLDQSKVHMGYFHAQNSNHQKPQPQHSPYQAVHGDNMDEGSNTVNMPSLVESPVSNFAYQAKPNDHKISENLHQGKISDYQGPIALQPLKPVEAMNPGNLYEEGASYDYGPSGHQSPTNLEFSKNQGKFGFQNFMARPTSKINTIIEEEPLGNSNENGPTTTIIEKGNGQGLNNPGGHHVEGDVHLSAINSQLNQQQFGEGIGVSGPGPYGPEFPEYKFDSPVVEQDRPLHAAQRPHQFHIQRLHNSSLPFDNELDIEPLEVENMRSRHRAHSLTQNQPIFQAQQLHQADYISPPGASFPAEDVPAADMQVSGTHVHSVEQLNRLLPSGPKIFTNGKLHYPFEVFQNTTSSMIPDVEGDAFNGDLAHAEELVGEVSEFVLPGSKMSHVSPKKPLRKKQAWHQPLRKKQTWHQPLHRNFPVKGLSTNKIQSPIHNNLAKIRHTPNKGILANVRPRPQYSMSTKFKKGAQVVAPAPVGAVAPAFTPAHATPVHSPASPIHVPAVPVHRPIHALVHFPVPAENKATMKGDATIKGEGSGLSASTPAAPPQAIPAPINAPAVPVHNPVVPVHAPAVGVHAPAAAAAVNKATMKEQSIREVKRPKQVAKIRPVVTAINKKEANQKVVSRITPTERPNYRPVVKHVYDNIPQENKVPLRPVPVKWPQRSPEVFDRAYFQSQANEPTPASSQAQTVKSMDVSTAPVQANSYQYVPAAQKSETLSNQLQAKEDQANKINNPPAPNKSRLLGTLQTMPTGSLAVATHAHLPYYVKVMEAPVQPFRTPISDKTDHPVLGVLQLDKNPMDKRGMFTVSVIASFSFMESVLKEKSDVSPKSLLQ